MKPQQPQRMNGLAITAFVSAFLVSIVGIVLGHVSHAQITRRAREGRPERGRGLAIAAFAIGYAELFLGLLLVVLIVPGLLQFGPGASGRTSSGPASIDAGTGSTTVDVYLDFMCPYCKQFHETNMDELRDRVDSGDITLRIHPMGFLDVKSLGTKYSTRAANALRCVAEADEDSMLDYVDALFSEQPDEATEGLSDAELIALAEDLGVSGVDDCVKHQRYAPWAEKLTEAARKGPIDGSDLKRITGTPTVLVNGEQYTGSNTDAGEFKDFFDAQSV